MTTDRISTESADDWESHWGDYAGSAEDNPAQRFRQSVVLDLLEAREAPKRLLDIGAGQGDLLARCAVRWPTAQLAGVELSAAGVAVAARKAPTAQLVQVDLLAPASDAAQELRGWATHAVCSEVLEHVDDPVRLLVSARRLLDSGARLVVTVPGGPRSAFDKHIGHRRHYTRGELAQLLTNAGFDDVDVQAAGFPVFNLYKLVVIARGAKVVADVRDRPTGLAAMVMKVFTVAFRVAPRRGRWGWQIVATATAP